MTTINSNPTVTHLTPHQHDRSSAEPRESTTMDAGGSVRKSPAEVGPEETEESSPGSAQPSPEPRPDDETRDDEPPT